MFSAFLEMVFRGRIVTAGHRFVLKPFVFGMVYRFYFYFVFDSVDHNVPETKVISPPKLVSLFQALSNFGK